MNTPSSRKAGAYRVGKGGPRRTNRRTQMHHRAVWAGRIRTALSPANLCGVSTCKCLFAVRAFPERFQVVSHKLTEMSTLIASTSVASTVVFVCESTIAQIRHQVRFLQALPHHAARLFR